MHANVVRVQYKDGEALESVVEGMQELVKDVSGLSGFQSIDFVRVAEAQSVHVVLFDSEQDAKDAREKMLPRFRDLAADHVSSDPVVENGPVLLHRGD